MGFRSSSCSVTTLGGGKRTISRLFCALPFPFSFSANGFQHSEQTSCSLPSISFCRHSLLCPHKSQSIIAFLQKPVASRLSPQNSSHAGPDRAALKLRNNDRAIARRLKMCC